MGSFIPQPSKIYFFESLIQKTHISKPHNISRILLTDVWSDIMDPGVVIL